MKTICSLLLLLFLIIDTSLNAQTYTLNWGSSFYPAWSNGHTSGTASLIGSSTINATLNITKSGGVYDHSNGSTGVSTPTVSGSAFTVGGSSSNLEIAVDFDNNTEHIDVVYQFSAPVTHVAFEIGDIDKPSATSDQHIDEVVITGSDGTVSHLPTITRYTAIDPNFLVISGNTANANAASGLGGNSASSASDQKGTVVVNFGSNILTTVTVRYKNAAGASANPSAQGIAIGNLSFQKPIPVPVTFTYIKAKEHEHRAVILWQTASEYNNSYFEVEKSVNGQLWSKVGTVPGIGTTSGLKNYSFTDPAVQSGTVHYRIRQVDQNGQSSLSLIVTVANNGQLFTADVYPNPLEALSIISLYSESKEEVTITLSDLNGKVIVTDTWLLCKGENELSLPQFAKIVKGHYVLHLYHSKTGYSKTIKLLKK